MPTSGGASECPMRLNAFQAVYVKTQSGFRRLDDVKRGLRFPRRRARGALHGTVRGGSAAHAGRAQSRGDGRRGRFLRDERGRPGETRAGRHRQGRRNPGRRCLRSREFLARRRTGRAALGGTGHGHRASIGPPILLVLSSYEAVTWNLNVLPGARLKAILLGGYKTSTVTGAGNTRIVSIQGYAHEGRLRGVPDARRRSNALDRAAHRFLPGTLWRKTFTVGGR